MTDEEQSAIAELSRRGALCAGAAGAIGIGMPGLLSPRSAAAESNRSRGPAKRCIFLFAWGGPSQIDTFDPKPDAPKEIRGLFKPIATRTPGILVSEHFRQVAQHSDKLAIVRSLTHDDPAHLSSAHLTLTGHFAPNIKSDAAPPSDRDTPHIGSVLSHLRGAPESLPPFVTIPWIVAHSAAPGGRAPGQSGGWLGRAHDPFVVAGDPSRPDWKIDALELQGGVSLDRLKNRNALLDSLEKQRWKAAPSGAAPGFGWQRQDAVELLTSPTVRKAFDLNREKAADRDRYGRNIHGQSVLLARRLIEHGVPLVSVNWHDDRRNYWDTHGNNFNRLKDDLIPPTDRAIGALLTDLEQSGLLSETLVVWVGEFGRSPVVNGSAGREHHPFCYCGFLAGGPIQGGQTYGKSDARAHYPISQPVHPLDFASTVLDALGVDEETTITDRLNQPVRVHGGKPITDLFG